MGQQPLIGFGFRDDPARDRQDEGVVDRDDAADRLLLKGAISLLPIHGDDFVDRHAGLVFDFPVQFDKGQAQRLARHRAQGGFPGAAQTDQADPLGAQAFRRRRAQRGQHPLARFNGRGAEQVGHLHHFRGPGIVFPDEPFNTIPQGDGDALQQADGDIARARFQLREIARGDTGVLGHHPPGHALQFARLSDPFSDPRQQCLDLGVNEALGGIDDRLAAEIDNFSHLPGFADKARQSP